METRANYAIIGIFTLAVVAAAFGFVYWFSGSDRGAKRALYRVEFSGSVAGLSKGAPVLFNGIRVGNVQEVYFERDRPQQAFARIEVQPDTPINTDTRAVLDTQILSGSAVISLAGGAPNAPALEKRPGQDLPTIEAERGGLGSLLETARGTADRANELLENVNRLVGDNRETIDRAVKNLAAFTDALGRNAPALDNLLSSVAGAANRIGPLSEKLQTLTDNANRVVAAIQPDRVSRIVENVDGLMETVRENRGQVAEILQETSAIVHQLNQATPKVTSLVDNLSNAAQALPPVVAKVGTLADNAGGLIKAVDPQRVNRIVSNADNVLTTLSDSRPQISDTVKNVAALTARLNDTAPKLDGLLTSLNIAAEGIGPVASRLGALTEETITRVRAIAPERLAQIVDNANQFTAVLADQKNNIDATLNNAKQLTAKLNSSADKIDSVLQSAQNFLGSAAGEEGKSTFGAIRLAADSFRRLTDNLDRRTADITNALNRLASVGTRQLESLGTDARRAVNNVGRAAKNLEQNPSAVIFGGNRASIPEYGR